MNRIEWQDSFLVGIDIIDYQHKRLFGLANLFFETVNAPKVQDLAESILHGMTVYARTHFAAEEAQMEKIDYPELTAHRAQHQAFVQRVEAMRAAEPPGLNELGDFLRRWLLEHIEVEDQKIRTYILQQESVHL